MGHYHLHPLHSYTLGSPLNTSYAEFFGFMLQFLCLQMCMYGGGVVPQGGVGDRHLVTIPQGVVGDRIPWGGERQGGGGVTKLVSVNNLKPFLVGLHVCAMDCNPRVPLIHICMLCTDGLQSQGPGYPREKSGNTQPGTTGLGFWV